MASNDRGDVEAPRLGLASRPHLTPPVGIAQELADRVGQALGRAGGDDDRGAGALGNGCRAGRCRRHDWYACRHRLDDRDPPRVAPRREDEQVGGSVVILGAVDGAREVHPATDAEGVRLAPVGVGVSAAHHDEMRIRPAAGERGERVGEALALEGVPDEEEDVAIRLDREVAAELPVLRLAEARDVDRGRYHVDALGRDAVDPDQVVAHLLGDHRGAQVPARPELEAFNRPHGCDLGADDGGELRARRGAAVPTARALRPASLLGGHDGGDRDDVVLPGRHAEHVDEVEPVTVSPNGLRGARGEAPAEEREADPRVRARERRDVVAEDPVDVDARPRVAIAVELETARGEALEKEDAVALEASRAVQVSVDEGDAHGQTAPSSE